MGVVLFIGGCSVVFFLRARGERAPGGGGREWIDCALSACEEWIYWRACRFVERWRRCFGVVFGNNIIFGVFRGTRLYSF